MEREPQPLGELLTPVAIEQLALPSNYRYGKAIYARRAIEFIEFNPLDVKAWIGGLDGSVAEIARVMLKIIKSSASIVLP